MNNLSTPGRRLGDLLIQPRETLDVELKQWLDLTDNAHRAVLAKAIIAMANHGGGYIIIGFEENAGTVAPAEPRPANLSAYAPDAVNRVVILYAEPPFHCDVSIHSAPDGRSYPIISVPGGHTAPIRAKRDGPQNEIRQNHYYVRRVGPQSEVPRSGREWDELIRRCIANAREQMLDQIRSLLLGGGAPTALLPAVAERNREWFDESKSRWEGLISDLPADHPARMPRGYFGVAYSLGPVATLGFTKLREALEAATLRHTGWPEFWVPTRDGIAPRVFDNTLECWIGGDLRGHTDAAHADYWRASPSGRLFLLRGLQEDSPDYGMAGGPHFEITTPTWRVGEALLHGARMAQEWQQPDAEITFLFEWTGLEGRTLAAHPSTNRTVFDRNRAHQNEFRFEVIAAADKIANALPELVSSVVTPLYELFDLFSLPPSLVVEELARMRSNRL